MEAFRYVLSFCWNSQTHLLKLKGRFRLLPFLQQWISLGLSSDMSTNIIIILSIF
ncbi:unnamed protein product [Spirodela intermedia]|uniref:Uncharacterized protein n=2 Tax=Spirodela intermedia TaxID=51605 RepID=A0A7I8J0J6_SPIIN|nr:unnamed protein product [Spirodela intermedia]CAA6663657.1 unnamed protein product [Spirodela intermedia]CAA7400146.1 unnamed protein product [Spirodela intermedia]